MNPFLTDEGNKMNRQEFITRDHLEYLDDLRERGDTNMFGARPYLITEFPDLKDGEAAEILTYWMATFPRGDTNE